jgi:hypothetical protein
MAYGNSYRTWGFDALLNYDQAARWESLIKPIRGDANGTKPLGVRNKKHMNIRKDEDTQDIVLRLNGHADAVRYKRNGDIVINIGGYANIGMHEFLGQLLGMSVRTYDYNAWVMCYYRPNRMEPAVAGEYIMPLNTDMVFRMDALSRVWVTSDVAPAFTHKVNREKSNLVRKSYTTFTRYLRNMVKLRTEILEKAHWTGDTVVERVVTISNEEITNLGITAKYSERLVFRPHSNGLAQNVRGMMISDDPEQHYKAFIHIAHGASGYSYMPQRGIAVYDYAITDFYNKFLLFAHKTDVLERVVSDNNSAKRDPYGAWFK